MQFAENTSRLNSWGTSRAQGVWGGRAVGMDGTGGDGEGLVGGGGGLELGERGEGANE